MEAAIELADAEKPYETDRAGYSRISIASACNT